MSRAAVSRILLVLLIALGLWAIGCGGGFNPATPSSFDSGSGSSSGVTLTGRFVGAGAGLRALASNVDDFTVVVLDSGGEEVGRVKVVNGGFTLRGLPAGSFTVVFLKDGDEVDRIRFDDLQANQQLAIVVEMVGGEIVLHDERRTGIGHGDVELEGRARQIDVPDPNDPMTGSLKVDGHHVVTRAAVTAIRRGNERLTLAELESGVRVHVKGEYELAPDGSQQVFAREIKLQDELLDDTGGETCDSPDLDKPGHILICHKGRTLSVSSDAWPGHAGHGDDCGPCK